METGEKARHSHVYRERQHDEYDHTNMIAPTCIEKEISPNEEGNERSVTPFRTVEYMTIDTDIVASTCDIKKEPKTVYEYYRPPKSTSPTTMDNCHGPASLKHRPLFEHFKYLHPNWSMFIRKRHPN